jgi:AraC-like DNA-binding protein
MSEFHSKNAVFNSQPDPVLHVPDIEQSLLPMGEEYIVGDLGVTAATDVLQGRMQVLSVQEGMVLYRTAVRDLCTMRTSNLLYPGIKIVLVLEGETQLSYGALRLHLRAREAGHCAAMVALARTDRFMRQWRIGRHERKLVLTLTPQWLAQAGVLHGRVAQFMAQHLAVAPWQPSARALVLADQLHRGCPLPDHLHALWNQSRCMGIVLEALASVEIDSTPAVAAPLARTGARQHVRLAALRDWLMTPAADGMDVAAIARHAGMSVAHLQRHFPTVAGQSLGRFLRVQRLLRARAALEQGRATVTQAAGMAGYRSSTHFSAAFRDHFGMLPSSLKPQAY